MDFFRVDFLRHRGIVGHISKQHCYQLSLPFDRTSVIEDLISQEFGSVGLGLVIIDGRDFFGPTEIMAASITKSAGRRIHLSTFWAGEFQFMATSIAKNSVFRILTLACRAFHFYALLVFLGIVNDWA
jgi:hypothetical protein